MISTNTSVLLCGVILGLFLVSCKDDCVTCSGATAAREYCPGDYQEKGDFQREVSAYEKEENAVCE